MPCVDALHMRPHSASRCFLSVLVAQVGGHASRHVCWPRCALLPPPLPPCPLPPCPLPPATLPPIAPAPLPSTLSSEMWGLQAVCGGAPRVSTFRLQMLFTAAKTSSRRACQASTLLAPVRLPASRCCGACTTPPMPAHDPSTPPCSLAHRPCLACYHVKCGVCRPCVEALHVCPRRLQVLFRSARRSSQ